MDKSSSSKILRFRRKLNLYDPSSGINMLIMVIYFLYYIALFILPIAFSGDVYELSRPWQEQSLILVGAIGIFSFLILLPPIIRSAISGSGSLDWSTRVISSLIGAFLYQAVGISSYSDPALENYMASSPQWVAFTHVLLAGLLGYFLLKYRRHFSMIEVSSVPAEAGVFTLNYGISFRSGYNPIDTDNGEIIWTELSTREQRTDIAEQGGHKVIIHPAEGMSGDYDCEVVAEPLTGWSFDSWSINDEKGRVISNGNKIRLSGHKSDFHLAAHFVRSDAGHDSER
jgi:hypothetical protein